MIVSEEETHGVCVSVEMDWEAFWEWLIEAAFNADGSWWLELKLEEWKEEHE